jgi:molybdopterin biosynthesis enzyme
MGILYAPDEADVIADRIRELQSQGAEAVLVSGGMSVDPDDVTPTAIAAVSDHVVTYGAPVLPGAMFMLASSKGMPILGIPGCGMYRRVTILDLIFPRVLAGIPVTRQDIIELGHGGLCLNCERCTYPVCPFGKA